MDMIGLFIYLIPMSLNSDQLDAFFEVAKCGSFSQAADQLAVSQPALSQRVKKLEETLQTVLFVRSGAGALLTDTGQRLLLYCRNKRDLEAEFLQPTSSGKLMGIIRVAGFSSIMRSTVIPALHSLLESNTGLQIELLTRELHELPELLQTAQSDFVLTDKPLAAGAIESHFLGLEANVLVESARASVKTPNIYFDHDANDQTTFQFFKKQNRKPPPAFKRSFLDDIYTIIDAVEQNWGRAIVPRHLIADNRRIRVVDKSPVMKTEVYLNYHTQLYYLPLHQALTRELSQNIPRLLGSLKP